VKVALCLTVVDLVVGTGKAVMTKEVPIDKWVATLETIVAQDIKFAMEFVVPKNFGVPGAIIVRNNHPNEFLLVSYSLDLPDKTQAHYITNSWVYNTSKTEGRIFFRNKV
jgi:lipoxygenase